MEPPRVSVSEKGGSPSQSSRNDSRGCSIASANGQRHEHAFDTLTGKSPQVREVLGNEHTVGQEDAMNRPVESGRALAVRKIDSPAVDAEKPHPAIDEPLSRVGAQ